MKRCGSMLVLGLVVVAAAASPYGKAVASSSSSSSSSPRNAIDDSIIEALENFRNQMAEGWPELGVPPLEPLSLGDFPVNVSVNGSRLEGMVSNVTVKYLSTFNIDLVHFEYLALKLDVKLAIPLLDVTGTYNLTGQYGAFPIYGNGPFRIDASNVSLEGVGTFGVADGGFGLTELDLDLGVLSTDIEFDDILGGGEMADLVNGLLSSMGPDIIQYLEDQYMPLLEEALRNEINQIISSSSRRPKDESVNDYFDLVFANLRHSIQERGEDPLALPADADNFTLTLFNRSFEGVVEAGPGRLWGLSTVHRAGNMEILYVGEQDEVVWQGEVGLIDLQVEYRLSLSLPLLGKDLGLSAKLSFLHLSFETDVFLHQSEITFAYCNITEMGPIHFKETGAGPLDTSLYNVVINALLGELQGVVASAVEGAVCALLEGAFASS